MIHLKDAYGHTYDIPCEEKQVQCLQVESLFREHYRDVTSGMKLTFAYGGEFCTSSTIINNNTSVFFIAKEDPSKKAFPFQYSKEDQQKMAIAAEADREAKRQAQKAFQEEVDASGNFEERFAHLTSVENNEDSSESNDEEEPVMNLYTGKEIIEICKIDPTLMIHVMHDEIRKNPFMLSYMASQPDFIVHHLSKELGNPEYRFQRDSQSDPFSIVKEYLNNRVTHIDNAKEDNIQHIVEITGSSRNEAKRALEMSKGSIPVAIDYIFLGGRSTQTKTRSSNI